MKIKEQSKTEGDWMLTKKIAEMMNVERNYSPFVLALRIALVYAVLGALWIILSDKGISLMVPDKDAVILLSVVKGWIYVAVTGVLIFLLIHGALRQVKNVEKELLDSYNRLTVTHEKLQDMVYFDFLTGLPNRLKFFEDHGKNQEGRRNTNTALFIINVDNLKLINDTFGHFVGDQIILATARRLSGCYREKGSFYSFGGNEFVLVLYYHNLNAVMEMAERTMVGFEEPILLKDNNIHITLSIGIATYPEHSFNPDQLLKNADIAMSKAKGTGKNQYVFYNTAMNDELVTRMTIEKHLRQAAKNNEFQICYQPQFDATAQKTIAFEALLRWKNPELGNVPPDKFIKVAEETNLIVPIGKWVLQNACAFIKELHERGYRDAVVCVNISIIQLLQNNFVPMVLAILDHAGLDPSFLELEITESVLMESYEIIYKKLEVLRRNNIRIAIDDFGKGYSSLNYLKILPVTTLKIDKSFIDEMTTNQIDQSIVEAVVGIGKKMGLNVIAEGIETKEQFDCAILKNCTTIQGYYFCKPLGEGEILNFLQKNTDMEMCV